MGGNAEIVSLDLWTLREKNCMGLHIHYMQTCIAINYHNVLRDFPLVLFPYPY